MKMSRFVVAATVVVSSYALPALGGPESDKPQNRCGWFDNPSPANAWLTDKDGEWIIARQGSNRAQGDWPRFRPSQWVRTNRSYGHGCACMKVVVDADSKEIREIISATARPLDACRKDRALKEPGKE